MRLFESEYSGELYQKVLELAGIFYAAGGRAFLVGGAVRDALLGRVAKDFDLEVHGLSAGRLLELLQGVCETDTVGMSFGVIKVKHLELDISLPRRENKTGAGHRGFLVEVDPELNIADAAARRDFTVNAVMYDPLEEAIIDPHNGVSDLEKKILRHVSSHFAEDPLRVLRGMQFAARMNFEVAPETIEMCAGISQEELAVERIGCEWEKMLLQGMACSKGLDFLKKCRWIRFYPELEGLAPDAWNALLAFMDRCARQRTGDRQKDLVFMTAALISPLTPALGKNFCRRLWNRSVMIERAAVLAETYRKILPEKKGSLLEKEIRRIALQNGGVELLCRLLAGGGREDIAGKIEAFARCEGIFDEPPRAIMTGKHGIALGIDAGPELGKWMKCCFEAQLDGVFSNVESGTAFLKQLISHEKIKKSEKK